MSMLRTFQFEVEVEDMSYDYEHDVTVEIEINDAEYGFIMKIDGRPYRFNDVAVGNLISIVEQVERL